MCGLYLPPNYFRLCMYIKSHSIDASQCSDAVCEALYADLLPILQSHEELSIEEKLALEELASCYNGNFNCDTRLREILEHTAYHIIQGLEKEIPKLAPYFILCLKSILK